ncbi:hypothetical protein Mgra_00007957, partial [Meloidogyne graminicola]
DKKIIIVKKKSIKKRNVLFNLIKLYLFIYFFFILLQPNNGCVGRNTTDCDNGANKCCPGLNCKYTPSRHFKCFKGNCVPLGGLVAVKDVWQCCFGSLPDYNDKRKTYVCTSCPTKGMPCQFDEDCCGKKCTNPTGIVDGGTCDF